MAIVQEEVSGSYRRQYNKLKKEYEDDLMNHLLDVYRTADKNASELEKMQEKRESDKNKISHLNEIIKESKQQILESKAFVEREPTLKDPNAISILSQALESMKSINESYAKENERLLKITNFSEYDEKINSFKSKIEKLSDARLALQEALKLEKEKTVNLELKNMEQEEKIGALAKSLAVAEKTISEKDIKIDTARDEINNRDTTITSFSNKIAEYEAQIGVLKDKVDAQQAQISSNAVSEQKSEIEESHIHN